MNVVERIDEHLDEASLIQYKALDAAGKILGMDVGKKGSIREILAKSKAVSSVNDIVKLSKQMAKIIVDEVE